MDDGPARHVHPSLRLGRQIAEAVAALHAIDARFALIGGLALASYGWSARPRMSICWPTRRTGRRDRRRACQARLPLPAPQRRGGECTRGVTSASICFMRPVRPRGACCRLPPRLATSLGELPVVSAEGLIGFKLQGLVNDASLAPRISRTSARCCAPTPPPSDMEEVRAYFPHIFDRESLLDELLREIS